MRKAHASWPLRETISLDKYHKRRFTFSSSRRQCHFLHGQGHNRPWRPLWPFSLYCCIELQGQGKLEEEEIPFCEGQKNKRRSYNQETNAGTRTLHWRTGFSLFSRRSPKWKSHWSLSVGIMAVWNEKARLPMLWGLLIFRENISLQMFADPFYLEILYNATIFCQSLSSPFSSLVEFKLWHVSNLLRGFTGGSKVTLFPFLFAFYAKKRPAGRRKAKGSLSCWSQNRHVGVTDTAEKEEEAEEISCLQSDSMICL